MGMERIVIFPARPQPSWPGVRDFLALKNRPVQMRMIDGQLAFPDEEPPAEWGEIRVAGSGGMVTLRREGERIHLIVWGNADASLIEFWNALAWALAEVGGGVIETPEGPLHAEEFCMKMGLSAR